MDYELQDFSKDVVEASNSIPVVIDFWAEWCGPCRQLGPVLERLAGEARGQWKLVKVDTDKNPDLAVQFNIRGIPAVKMVYQGQLVAEFTGAQPEHVIKQWLKEHLPSNGEEQADDEIMNSVRSLLGEGEREQAYSQLATRMNGETEPEERILYAMLKLPGNIDEAGKLLEEFKEQEKYAIEFETLATVKHLKKIAAEEVSVKSGNKQAGEIYVNGAKALFSNNFEEALQHFIQCLQLDRQLDDDGARKACIAIFTLLTHYHPLTVKYRRQFSMSLY